jgi:hypothetical protein
MIALTSILVFVFASIAFGYDCLSDTEATNIATQWVHIWSTGVVHSTSDLSSIVTSNVEVSDEAFPPAVIGIDAFLGALLGATTTTSNSTVTNIVQAELFNFHSCNQIAVRWQYNGVTTGVAS